MFIALNINTILNGKYIIESVVETTDSYIVYKATDLLIREEVIIREFYYDVACSRDLFQSDSIIVDDVNKNNYELRMNFFKSQASSMARDTKNYVTKNFFYENNTAYVVLVEVKSKVKKNSNKKINILAVVGILIILACVLLAIKGFSKGEKEETEQSDEGETNEIINATVVMENNEKKDKAIDLTLVENNLKLELENAISGDIIKTFFGDFNDDGKYEMWATVWDKEGVPYNDIMGTIDSWKLAQNCEANSYGLDIGKEYKQIQIWYVDEKTADMIDDFVSMKLTEEYVNGKSSHWGEDTFYYPFELDIQLIRFGKLQQLCISVSHTWMTGRGWGVYSDQTIALYDNEDGPKACIKEHNDNSSMIYELRNDSICVSYYEEYYLRNHETEKLYYPVYYINEKFCELTSVEIDLTDIQKIKGYKTVYADAMNQTLIYDAYVAGMAANVSYSLPVEKIEFEQFLYNDNGYIFLNGKAFGMMEETVSSIGEMDPYYSDIDICLELRIKDGIIEDYRWLGAHQKKNFTEYEKLNSDMANATLILSDNDNDEIKEEEKLQEKVSLTVYSAENVSIKGNYAELKGVIQETGEDRTYIIDDETKIIADTQYFSKYKDGMSGYDWLEKLSSGLNDSNWMDICGVYEMLVSDNHVDVITGLYWWD